MLFTRLTPFMLFSNKFPIHVSETIKKSITTTTITKPKVKTRERETTFYPNPHYRSLFRCLYVLNNGVDEFKKLMKDPHLLIKESEIAISYIEQCRVWFKENEHKQYPKLSTIESELVTKMQPISIASFFTLCAVFNKPVMLEYDGFIIKSYPVQDCIYHKLTRQSDNGHYGIELEPKKYEDTPNKVLVSNLNKPLFGLSHYKICDLIELSIKFKLPVSGKHKIDLYAQVQQYYKDHGFNYK
jgi:hypothetical protein